jgi:prophage regulatory protein
MRRSRQFNAPRRPAVEARVVDDAIPQSPSGLEIRGLLRPATASNAGTAETQTIPRGNDEELWNIRTVVQKTGLSRATIYRYVRHNLFPPRCRLGPGRIAWLASEVLAWMHSRPRPNT